MRTWSRNRVFGLLMLLALGSALLPTAWTSWPRMIFQPLGWAQSAASTAIRAAFDPRARLSAAPDELSALRELVERQSRVIGQQGLLLDTLRRQLDTVSGIREQLGEASTRIIFAAVLAYDASPRRESLLIAKGSLQGVEPGQWVIAGVPAEQRDPHATGQRLLLEQWVVGRINEVQPQTSRVLLTTDPSFGPEPASTARQLSDGTWLRSGKDCLVRGAGGAIRIEAATENFLETGFTLVLLSIGRAFPVTMTLGQITGATPVPESALHFDLQVRPWGKIHELRQVYVLAQTP